MKKICSTCGSSKIKLAGWSYINEHGQFDFEPKEPLEYACDVCQDLCTIRENIPENYNEFVSSGKEISLSEFLKSFEYELEGDEPKEIKHVIIYPESLHIFAKIDGSFYTYYGNGDVKGDFETVSKLFWAEYARHEYYSVDKECIALVNQFNYAFEKLNQYISDIQDDDVIEILGKDYPFKSSFDDVCVDVKKWTKSLILNMWPKKK